MSPKKLKLPDIGVIGRSKSESAAKPLRGGSVLAGIHSGLNGAETAVLCVEALPAVRAPSHCLYSRL